MFSDGPGNNCPTNAPRGTLLATGNAFVTAARFISAGGNMVGVTVTGNSNVRAYASSKEIMLINLSQGVGAEVTVSVDGSRGGLGGPIVDYDKALYDRSKTGIWAAPKIGSLPPRKGTKLHLWLRRWSVTVAPLI